MAIHIIEHPLIQHKLTILRDKHTDNKTFRDNCGELVNLMCCEVLKDLELKDKIIDTPIIEQYVGKELEHKIVVVPILRAGLWMAIKMGEIIPTLRYGFIGLARDEKTLEPIEYYSKFPEIVKDAIVVIVDPIIATGGSASLAISKLKESGAKKIKLFGLISVEEGLNNVITKHPDVDIYIAEVDEKLNKNGFLVPGIGDAGDRLYGTDSKF